MSENRLGYLNVGNFGASKRNMMDIGCVKFHIDGRGTEFNKDMPDIN